MRLRLTLIIYLFSIGLLIYFNPIMFYTKENKLKTFGTSSGDNNDKTLLPLWLVIILIAFFSYYLAAVFIILLGRN